MPHLSIAMLRNFIFSRGGLLADGVGPVVAATNLLLDPFCPTAELKRNLLFSEDFATVQLQMRFLPNLLEFLRFCGATQRRIFFLDPNAEYFAGQMTRLGIADLFEEFYHGATKSDQIDRILEQNHLIPGETAYVGDRSQDFRVARHHGVMTIAICVGSEPRKAPGSRGPDVIVRDLGELPKLLEAISPRDEIRIQELELRAQVGVPDTERAQPQRLTATLVLQPLNQFSELKDDLRRTIDYAAVSAELQHFVSRRQDRLIETLANEMAEHLLQQFPLFRVELELRKFVLPETRHVAVRVVRQRASGG